MQHSVAGNTFRTLIIIQSSYSNPLKLPLKWSLIFVTTIVHHLFCSEDEGSGETIDRCIRNS
ncbi:hypothetical protein WN55_04707 [Dufourea novaeangliae]|uniref:Uncharacterized protein n=1 Tax=Dufourea novaeangliae TaxID=178035 RepID=A0A154P1N5_DUFNO|nr:hypothetical protein WN55_04707 [Dufourea novaeangliae]